MNIQQMMKQAQQMQDKLQKQMADMRVEATAGGGMVTVVINGAKQVLSLKIDPEAVSKDDVEMLQDLILAAINDAHRKADEAMQKQMSGHDGRPEDPGHVLMARPDPLAKLIEQLQRLPGIGAKSAQRLAFHVLKTPREDVERLADAMREVKDRVTYCSVCSNITDADPCYFCTDSTRDHRIICVVEEPENVTAVEKTRDFKGTYHVLMGALSPLHGVGPGRPEDQGTAHARRQRRRRGSDPRDQPQRRRGGDRHLPGQAAEAARRPRDAHRHGRARRQRPRIRRRGHDAQGRWKGGERVVDCGLRLADWTIDATLPCCPVPADCRIDGSGRSLPSGDATPGARAAAIPTADQTPMRALRTIESVTPGVCPSPSRFVTNPVPASPTADLERART